MGSLAGAAQLLNNNEVVQNQSQVGRKPTVEHMGIRLTDSDLQCGYET